MILALLLYSVVQRICLGEFILFASLSAVWWGTKIEVKVWVLPSFGILQCTIVVSYRRLGTTYGSHLQCSSCPRWSGDLSNHIWKSEYHIWRSWVPSPGYLEYPDVQIWVPLIWVARCGNLNTHIWRPWVPTPGYLEYPDVEIWVPLIWVARCGYLDTHIWRSWVPRHEHLEYPYLKRWVPTCGDLNTLDLSSQLWRSVYPHLEIGLLRCINLNTSDLSSHIENLNTCIWRSEYPSLDILLPTQGDLSFSSKWPWRLLSAKMWRRIVWWAGRACFCQVHIFTILNMETAGFLQVISIYLPISRRHGTESNTHICSSLLCRLLSHLRISNTQGNINICLEVLLQSTLNHTPVPNRLHVITHRRQQSWMIYLLLGPVRALKRKALFYFGTLATDHVVTSQYNAALNHITVKPLKLCIWLRIRRAWAATSPTGVLSH